MALPAALRVFRSRPGTTAAIVPSVGVAIGALVATFSLVDAVLLAPLPFPDSQAIVMIAERDARRPDERLAVSVHTFRMIEATRDVLVDQAAIQTITAPQVWAGDRVPRELRALSVTPNFFEVLGVTCAVGRTFRAEDASASTPPIIVSHRFWTDSLGADERVMGTSVLIGGQSSTIVGVAPRGFTFADATVDYWWPARLPERSLQRTLLVVGRLRSGVSAQTAEQRLQAVLMTNTIAAQRETRLRVASLADEAVRAVRQTLWLLLFACAALCVISLGVAVLGVFSVVAFRVRVHLRELALRLALGADLRQIVLLVMRRTVVAAVLGILIGVGATVASSRLIQSLFHDSGRMQLSMLAVAAIALVTIGLVAAYLPARRARRIDPGVALRTD